MQAKKLNATVTVANFHQFSLYSHLATTTINFILTSNPNVDPPTFTLTCTSTGGPATNVTWTRDGNALDDSTATARRKLDDAVTATYTLTLSVTGRLPGLYKCNVTRDGPATSPMSVERAIRVESKCT